jgi:N utilization substance protein A
VGNTGVVYFVPENQKISEKLADQLGVDAEVAGVLIDEGFSSVDDIADADAASSSTATSIEFLSSSTTMELTSAGAIALITYCAGSSSHKITSTRSPFNSFS